MATIIPKEELRLPLPRMYCPYCEKYRYWDPASGVEGSIFGRYMLCQCRTCKRIATWPQ